MKAETNISYLSAMYYTAGVLLILTALFSALGHDWALAAVWFALGIAIFAIHRVTSKKEE